jgi:hypothetical protein
MTTQSKRSRSHRKYDDKGLDLGPIGRCPYCHELIYTPFMEHGDDCKSYELWLSEYVKVITLPDIDEEIV